MPFINKPDLNKPRFRNKAYTITDDNFYKSFKDKYPRYKDVDVRTIQSVIKTFNETVFQTVIDNRDGVALPESLGWLFIGTCEYLGDRNVNFAKSIQYGVKVLNKNWDTDGKLAKIFYSTIAPKIKMLNREYWGLNSCRKFTRAVSKSYSENWSKYIQVVASQRIKSEYTKNVYKNMMSARNKESLKTYNEFEL